MVIFLILVVCVLVALATYGFLLQAGLLPGASARTDSSARVPRLGELPQGCLIGVVVAGAAWFLAWGIVLVLALRLLRTPFEN